MSGLIKRHGLTRNTKRLVFDALYLKQQGKCFICGVSQAERVARCAERGGRALAPVHWKLHIDHCHWSGRIRGLLCESCNIWLGRLENYGFREKPEDMTEYDFADTCECIARWMEKHHDRLFQYMQRDRWLPRKDILFHLQRESREQVSA